MRTAKIVVGCLGAAALAGCPFVTNGLPVGGFNGTGGGGSSSTGGSSSSSTGGPADGGVCKPGEEQPCYTGDAGTEGVGTCAAGIQTCKGDGTGYGPCTGDTKPAPGNCASTANAHCDTPAPTCTGDLAAGGKAWGEGGDDRALGIAIDSGGNTVVSGFFNGMLDFGGGAKTATDGQSDGFVAKYDATAMLEWMLQLGDTGNDQATAVAVDANDNVYVVGSFNNKVTFQTSPTATTLMGGPGIFVAKLDKDGKPQWANGYTGSGTHVPQAVALSGDGNVLAVAGTTSGDLTIGGTLVHTPDQNNDYDGFVFTIDSGGTKVGWVQHVKSTNNNEYQALNGVAIGTDGSVFVVGSAKGDVDFGDTLPVTMHGNGQNLAFARYTSLGAITWKQLVGADNTVQIGGGVALGPGGDMFLTGAFQGQLAFHGMNLGVPVGTPSSTNATFVVRLDGSGSGVWGKAFTPINLGNPNNGTDSAGYTIVVDAFSVLVGGYFTDALVTGLGPVADAGADAGGDAGDGGADAGGDAGAGGTITSKGGKDGLAIKLAADIGTFLWAAQFGDANDDQINRVAFDPRQINPLGASAVAGQFAKSVDVGGGPVSCIGSNDIFFARLAP